jgi:hypothetical protein
MRRSDNPMKYWGFYVSEELKAQTIECAKTANESDSEYIRKAVEQRNAQCALTCSCGKQVFHVSTNGKFAMCECGKTYDNSGKEVETNSLIKKFGETVSLKKPTIPELKEKVKKMEKPDRMVQSFMKGGK